MSKMEKLKAAVEAENKKNNPAKVPAVGLAELAEDLRAKAETPDGQREHPAVSAKLALQLVEEILRLRSQDTGPVAISGPARIQNAVAVCPSCGHAVQLKIDDVFPVKGA